MPEKQSIEKIGAMVDEQESAMFAMLERLVNQESGSSDVADVNALGELLAGAFSGIGCDILRYPAEGAGFPLLATLLPNGAPKDAGRIFLLGHRDTVFPAGTAATRPFTRDAARCYGPGVADMKGGIVAGFFAMKILKALESELGPIPMEILLTSDEEVGSAVSAPAILDRCATARACFCLEPARAKGEIVTGRSGAGLFTITARGKASHAGILFSEGVSAINGLASVITAIAALSDDAGGMTVNTGLIAGGTGAFIVPEQAVATVSLRFDTLALRDTLVQNIRAIIAEHNTNGLTVIMTDPLCYLPMTESDGSAALYSLTQEAGKAYGAHNPGIVTKGSSDSGLTSCNGVPTLCGMGVVGGNLHMDAEYMESPSLAERTKVLALAMLLARDHFIR